MLLILKMWQTILTRLLILKNKEYQEDDGLIQHETTADTGNMEMTTNDTVEN